MEEITTLSLVGIYLLLILSLFFSFVIGVRIHQLNSRISAFEKKYDEYSKTIKTKVEKLEDSFKR
ncbi:MAG: hypothetical protein QME59_00230 [Candidatus Hydrothermarchaeota archaeon]|nr:hypothetical protein [Candidatus Hydrothermarchaeota archaeon]